MYLSAINVGRYAVRPAHAVLFSSNSPDRQGSYITIEPGQTVRNVKAFSNLHLKVGATITGNAVVGGTATLLGTIEGDLTARNSWRPVRVTMDYPDAQVKGHIIFKQPHGELILDSNPPQGNAEFQRLIDGVMQSDSRDKGHELVLLYKPILDKIQGDYPVKVSLFHTAEGYGMRSLNITYNPTTREYQWGNLPGRSIDEEPAA